MTDIVPAAAGIEDAFWLAADQLMLHHVAPWELDEALTDWGYRIGPCEAQDLVGLDVVLARRRAMPDGKDAILGRMVAEGRLGKKGGWGYYRYPGGGGAVIDPLLEDLIREEAWFAGIERVDLSAVQIVARMNRALSAAVSRLVKAGVPRDEVDRIVVTILHYPKARLDSL